MSYLGNSPVLSQQEYRNIDDISGSFNGSTTSFALLVNGVAPVPAPQASNQCLISVNGVVQKPDDTGATGFRLSGGNIVFSAAPSSGQAFFGVILAGADYIYAGQNYPDGTVSAPSITFAQDLDTGFYRSGAGEVKFTANGANTVTLSSNNLTAPSFIPTSSSAPTNGVYLSAANTVAIATNSAGKLFINSSGQVGIGTSSPGVKFDVVGTNVVSAFKSTNNQYVTQLQGNDATYKVYLGTTNANDFLIANESNNGTFAERLRITSAGNVGIGTTAPSQLLEIKGANARFAVNSTTVADGGILLQGNGTTYAEIKLDASSGVLDIAEKQAAGNITFSTGTTPTERARIDSSGRLLVGTTTARSTGYGTPQYFQEGVNRYESIALCVNESVFAGRASVLQFARSRGGSLGSSTAVSNGDALGFISFFGADGTDIESGAATIACEVDGTPGADDMPGRLVFSTTADGASSPTEAMRINNKGQVCINSTGTGNGRGLFLQAATVSQGDYTIYTVNSANTKIDFGVRTDGYLRSEAVYTQTSGSAANVFVDSGGFLFRSTSSERYKRDIVEAPYTLEQIDRLRAVNYKSSSPNADGEVSDQVFGGLIAEEVNQAGFEEFVVFDDQGQPDALQYGHMIAVAIKGLQEAHSRIKELETEVAALKAQ